MVDETAQRKKKEFELRRLAERGSDEYDRGSDEYDRGSDEYDRGSDEYDRGSDEYDRGGGLGRGSLDQAPHRVALDIFRQAASLGGHLVVAFVAPIGATSRRAVALNGARNTGRNARDLVAQLRKQARARNPSPQKKV
jgi:hypothetical protein